MNDDFTLDDARRIATDWHSGMMTAMYALSSTGSLELYPGEGTGRLLSELLNTCDAARADDDIEGLADLEALAQWVRKWNVYREIPFNERTCDASSPWDTDVVFDNTSCALCDDVVAGHLYLHTHLRDEREAPRWTPAFRTPTGKIVCGDCIPEDADVVRLPAR